jgi:integrase
VVTLVVTLKVLVVTMTLTDFHVRNAEPKEKQYKLSAGLGLYLIVAPNGGKWWRVRYRFGGKQKELSVGTYTPSSTTHVSLKAAIIKRDEIRVMVANDIDPGVERKANKIANATDDTFREIALEWHQKHSPAWSKSYADRTFGRMNANLIRWMGDEHINNISPQGLLAVLRRTESRGTLYTAHKLRQITSQIFRYAMASGKATSNPADVIIGALPPAKTQHYATITEPRAVGKLMRDINNYKGTHVVCSALKFAPYVMSRPANIAQARWEHFDLDKAEWRTPVEDMKGNQQHIVPLSKQALAILKDIHTLTGSSEYVFPSNRSNASPMSIDTLRSALRRMGYGKGEITTHGFRGMASTMLNEQGWNGDAIERQLAHVEGNSVRSAYNHAQHMPERKKMMQSWADYLDGLASGAEVISINRVDNS